MGVEARIPDINDPGAREPLYCRICGKEVTHTMWRPQVAKWVFYCKKHGEKRTREGWAIKPFSEFQSEDAEASVWN